jgi:hypothetical protein
VWLQPHCVSCISSGVQSHLVLLLWDGTDSPNRGTHCEDPAAACSASSLPSSAMCFPHPLPNRLNPHTEIWCGVRRGRHLLPRGPRCECRDMVSALAVVLPLGPPQLPQLSSALDTERDKCTSARSPLSSSAL